MKSNKYKQAIVRQLFPRHINVNDGNCYLVETSCMIKSIMPFLSDCVELTGKRTPSPYYGNIVDLTRQYTFTFNDNSVLTLISEVTIPSCFGELFSKPKVVV